MFDQENPGFLGDQRKIRIIAELNRLSPLRMTMIMNLQHLAPNTQEAILLLPLVVSGGDPVNERMLRAVAAEVRWKRQREVF